jgi:carbonic anhydrase
MNKKQFTIFIFTLLLLQLPELLAEGKEEGVSKEIALQRLMLGNKRFVSSKMTHENQSAKRRAELAKGQHPFAVVVTCSDSRVSPEILFDQGLGDIFVIRVAGNVIDDNALGSIEYAVDHLGTKLVVVLGHTKCGAVSAAAAGGEVPGHIKSICEAISPAVEKARTQEGDLVENSIINNIKEIVNKLRISEPVLKELVDDETIMVVPAEYDITSGKVTLLRED